VSIVLGGCNNANHPFSASLSSMSSPALYSPDIQEKTHSENGRIKLIVFYPADGSINAIKQSGIVLRGSKQLRYSEKELELDVSNYNKPIAWQDSHEKEEEGKPSVI
jgi:hypothetical protein